MNHKLDPNFMARRLGALSLGAVALASCAADSGAVAKPLVFESSAKRAAAISSGPQRGVGAAGGVAQASGAAGAGTSTSTSTSTSTMASAAMAQAASTSAKPAAGAKGAAAAGGGGPQASTAPAQRGGAGSSATMQPSAAGSTAANAGAPATEAGAPTTTGATACSMMVTYNAVGMHGMWYPHNIGALWIEDASGKFVKTLERWAGIRAGYLSHWNKREDQHGKWPSCPFANVCTGPMVPDQMDVMSQATIFEDNATHMAKWSCKNIDGEVVPDGKYKLFFEEMENIYPTFEEGPLGMVEFEKGPSGVTLMPPDQPPYKNLKIVIEPTAR